MSGRSSCRATPVMRSTSRTRAAGTRRHCDTAWDAIPRPAASLVTDPARRTASCSGVVRMPNCKPDFQLMCKPIFQRRLASSRLFVSMAFKDTLMGAMAKKGVNQSELARHLKIESQSVNQWIKGKTVPRGARLNKVAAALDVTVSELLGVSEQSDPDVRARQNRRSVVVAEIDVRAQGGSGADDTPMNGNGTHVQLDEWSLPADYLRSHVASPSAVRIIRIVGDSMEPNYAAGDRVLVDTSHLTPSPPGVYVVWDGFGLILKHVEVLAGRQPAVARLSSDNPAYAPYEAAVSDIQVQGRVVGKWVWK